MDGLNIKFRSLNLIDFNDFTTNKLLRIMKLNPHLYNMPLSDDIPRDILLNVLTEAVNNNVKIELLKLKIKIPKRIKDLVWKLKGQELCPICNIATISFDDYECGHIISEKNGGHSTIDNLIPICNKCNKSMNSTNLNEWCFNYFPNSIYAIQQKQQIKSKQLDTYRYTNNFMKL